MTDDPARDLALAEARLMIAACAYVDVYWSRIVVDPRDVTLYDELRAARDAYHAALVDAGRTP